MLFERRTSSGHYSATSTVSAPLTLVFRRAVWTRLRTNTTRTSTIASFTFRHWPPHVPQTLCCKVDDATPRSLVPCSLLRRDSWQSSLSPLLGCVNISTPPSLSLPLHPSFLVSARTEWSVPLQHWRSLLGDWRGSPSSYLTCPCGTLVAWKITRGATSSFYTAWCFPLPTIAVVNFHPL